MTQGILLISCPDQQGITAAVTAFIAHHGGNIVDLQQHTDQKSNKFFMRIVWETEGFNLKRDHFADAFRVIVGQYTMSWSVHYSDDVPRVAIFVSQHLHCLHDVLYRYRAGQLRCTIPLIISNHEAARTLAEDAGIEFHCMPVTADNKKVQEAQQIVLLKEAGIDVIALARYHQILTNDFIQHFPNKIINIHHSFLPAFVGQKPYDQAYDKGVKIIGATSHYVITALDQGPIIAQDVAPISHRHTVEDLKHLGQDVEKAVFYKALDLHLSHKILCYENKTVVFD